MTDIDPTDQFLDWLIAMDDPNNPDGAKARQTVTLSRIIEHARGVKTYRELAAVAVEHECQPEGEGLTGTLYECPDCGATWIKIRRMIGRQTRQEWRRPPERLVQRMREERRNTRPVDLGGAS